METETQSALSYAVLTLLRPLVRILLRNGIAFNTFAEMAKKVYVDVAFDDFTEPGKKQTISRVSVLTGLTRKEAKRLRELARDDLRDAAQRYHRAVRVIGGWLNDPRFQEADGSPRPLPLDDGEISFATLVKAYSGDIPTQAMFAVLNLAGCIEQNHDGQIMLVKHAYIPGNDPVDKLRILGTDTAELIATIDHNLTAPNDKLHYQRKVSNARVSADALTQFQQLSASKAQQLLEELDAWLSAHEAPDNRTGRYVSLGIYYYQPPSDEETSS